MKDQFLDHSLSLFTFHFPLHNQNLAGSGATGGWRSLARCEHSGLGAPDVEYAA